MESSTESLRSRIDRLAMSNLIDSNVDLAMYLIGTIRFGS